MKVAQSILLALEPSCERIIIAGSLRREKPEVGDIELVYIPRFEMRPKVGDMFERENANLADLAIRRMIETGKLELRQNANGSVTYGDKNKLCRHSASGIPVDLFSTTENKWWNTLVVRTGPKELNQRIATIAQSHGCRWNVYDVGFTDKDGNIWPMGCEEAVFKFVGIPYACPRERK